jgi:UDP-glucuronate 4-epimerase
LATGEVPDTQTNVNDLVEHFHHQPATTIKDGIQRFVNWYLEFYGQ